MQNTPRVLTTVEQQLHAAAADVLLTVQGIKCKSPTMQLAGAGRVTAAAQRKADATHSCDGLLLLRRSHCRPWVLSSAC
jgi:hypothetical protein